jgi:hypothetical protein
MFCFNRPLPKIPVAPLQRQPERSTLGEAPPNTQSSEIIFGSITTPKSKSDNLFEAAEIDVVSYSAEISSRTAPLNPDRAWCPRFSVFGRDVGDEKSRQHLISRVFQVLLGATSVRDHALILPWTDCRLN